MEVSGISLKPVLYINSDEQARIFLLVDLRKKNSDLGGGGDF